MSGETGIDDPRRMVLVRALSAGLLGTCMTPAQAITFGLLSSKPTKLPEGQSIFRMSGNVAVNKQAATMDTRIKPGDTVQTGKDSEIVFVVGTQAMILRENSELEIEAAAGGLASLVIAGLRMLTGKLLSVSRDSKMQVRTATSTVGIRGTGFYVEADPERTYFCTCYGVTDVHRGFERRVSIWVRRFFHG